MVPGLVLVLVALPGAAAAQRPDFDIRVGMSFARMWLDELPGSTSRTGFTAGGVLGIPVTSWLRFQPELHYAQRGSDLGDVLSELVNDPRIGGDFSFGYVELPVLMRATRDLGDAIPSLFGGLTLAFRTACRFTARVNAETVLEDKCGDVDFETSSTDLGLTMGARLDIPVSPQHGSTVLFAEFRYLHGLSNVNASPIVEARAMKHRVVTLAIGGRVGRL